MDIEEFNDNIDLITKYPRPTYYKYDIEIHVGKNIKFRPYALVGIDNEANFKDDYSQKTVITLSMSLGDYLRNIYAHRDADIYIKLTKQMLDVNGDELDTKPITLMYRAFVHDKDNFDMSSKPNIDLDNAIKEFNFDLMEINTYNVKTRRVGGIFRKTKHIDILKFLLARVARAVPENLRSLGIEYIEPNNKKDYFQTIIKDGMKLTSLHRYLQKNYGIYNHGISMFYNQYKKRWFIFPTFNTALHDKTKFHLDVYVGSPKTQILDRTWMYHESQKWRLSLIATGSVRTEDLKQIEYMNSGNAIKFILGEKLFHEQVGIDENKLKFDNKHLAGFFLEEREEDAQIVQYGSKRVTNNVCHEMSHLSRKAGMHTSIEWKNCRTDLLVPGMPVTINTITEKGIEKNIGILHGFQSTETRLQKGMQNNVFYSDCILKVFVDNPRNALKDM